MDFPDSMFCEILVVIYEHADWLVVDCYEDVWMKFEASDGKMRLTPLFYVKNYFYAKVSVT